MNNSSTSTIRKTAEGISTNTPQTSFRITPAKLGGNRIERRQIPWEPKEKADHDGPD